eukprot:TRINITY_DN4188_c0_g1_i2.p1 TRINITY_DN4188_c0_g1~~TRINITY_DN4188_c0_g1_i2.p1  ORF type:complete len:208 (-),score=45.56 TRINITY_DN4188_c0_g1_i2:486-1109(-)
MNLDPVGRDFWTNNFNNKSSMPWKVFFNTFQKEFRPKYKNRPSPDNITGELQRMLVSHDPTNNEEVVTMTKYFRFVEWFHPFTDFTHQIIELRARGLLCQNFIGFVDSKEVAAFHLNPQSCQNGAFVLRFSSSEAANRGISISIVENKSLSNYIFKYKPLRGFKYNDEIFETINELLKKITMDYSAAFSVPSNNSHELDKILCWLQE